MKFDCLNTSSNSIKLGAQGVNSTNDVIQEECEYFNSTGTGIAVSIESTSTGINSNHAFIRCKAYDNGTHGFFISARNSTLLNCEAYGNGVAATGFGGHGISLAAARTEVTSGWALVSGSVYNRTLAAAEVTVYHVTNLTGIVRLTKNIGTPTTPGANEWGQSGTTLYVNIGSTPNGKTLIYAWSESIGNVIKDCVSRDNINGGVGLNEGHGIALDDYSSFTTVIGCKSFDNEGIGYTVNRGDGNRFIGCESRDNKTFMLLAYGQGGSVINCTSTDDNLVGVYNEVVTIAQYATGWTFKNNLLVGNGQLYGIGNRSLTINSHTIDRNIIAGFGAPTLDNVETNTILTAPAMVGVHPSSGSTAYRAGSHVGYRTDADGKQFNNPPTIGAYEVMAARATRT
jgi:hypothetical protein